MHFYYGLLISTALVLFSCKNRPAFVATDSIANLQTAVSELPASQARPLRALLGSSDGSTPTDSIVRWLELVKASGTCPVSGSVLTALLAENHPIYQERGTRTAKRLRTFLLATLGDTGVPPHAAPYLLAELRYYHKRDLRTLAAATRAAGRLPYLDSNFVAALMPLLNEDFPDEEMDLDEYAPEYPYLQTTLLKREVLQLLVSAPMDGRLALPALVKIQQPRPGSIYGRYPPLRQTAHLAAERIRADSVVFYPNLDHLFAPDALGPEERINRTWPDWPISDQYNRVFNFKQLRGRPFALTFYYSSCRNYNKCSMTATRFRQLERKIQVAGLAEEVAICALSLDPAYDVPARNLEYFTARGPNALTSFAYTLTADEEGLPDLLRDLDVGVSYGAGQVALHGIELLLFDAKGRLARRYRNTHWEDERVLADLRALVDEDRGIVAHLGL